MTKDQAPILCNPHPDAPHGFSRNSSHNLGRYVCDCEGWTPDESPAPDCRTCTKYRNGYCYILAVGLSADAPVPVCTNGDQYVEATKVVLWRTE